MRPENVHELSKPWTRAAILRVKEHRVDRVSTFGAASAIPRPSTPSSAHAARARVGPEVPPCFLLPPERRGDAVRPLAHAEAPAHLLAMKG